MMVICLLFNGYINVFHIKINFDSNFIYFEHVSTIFRYVTPDDFIDFEHSNIFRAATNILSRLNLKKFKSLKNK